MNDTYGMTLNSPMTREDWAKLTDANMEHTQSVTFQTEGGKEVEFVKVVHCKDCKYYPDGNGTTKWLPCREMITREKWFCADGERRDKT